MSRPTHIEDYLAQLHNGQWFGWSDSKNKVYANLIILDDTKSKPSESDCTTGLATLQPGKTTLDLSESGWEISTSLSSSTGSAPVMSSNTETMKDEPSGNVRSKFHIKACETHWLA